MNFGDTTTGVGVAYHANEMGDLFPEANYHFFSDGVSGRSTDFAFYGRTGPSFFRAVATQVNAVGGSAYFPTINDNTVLVNGATTPDVWLPIAYPLNAVWGGGETVDTNGIDITNPTGGPAFSPSMAGAQVVINGVTYTVLAFLTSTHVTLTSSAGVQTGVSFAVLPQVPLGFELTIMNFGTSTGPCTVHAPLGAVVSQTGNPVLLPGQSCTVRAIFGNGTWFLVGNGGPATTTYTSLDLTNQSTAVSASLFAPQGAGTYRITWNAKITTPDSTSSILGGISTIPQRGGFQVIYKDNDDAVSVTTPPWGVGTYSGTVNTATAGLAVTWVSGNLFNGEMVGRQIQINGTKFTVDSVTNSTSLVLTADPGNHAGVDYIFWSYPIGATLNTTQAQLSGEMIINLADIVAVQYLFGYTAGTGDMRYSLHVKVEQIT